MNKKYKVLYLPTAANDLREIFEYIQEENPKAALRLLDEIDSSISNLETFPFMGVIPKDIRLQRLNYRMLIVDIYLVFYVVFDNIVEIRRVLYGKRKYSFLL